MGAVRVCLAAALALAGCLQCTILLSAQEQLSDDDDDVAPPLVVRDADYYGSRAHARAVLVETVRLLFMDDASAASAYLLGLNVTGPGDVAFHVRELPAGVQTAASVSSCMEGWGHSKEIAGRTLGRNASKERFLEVHCGWSSGVCNPTAHTDGSQYSTRRLNGNADAVIARLFSDYEGPLRTDNASEAAFKVVPYPHSSNAACPRPDGSFDVLRRDTDWISRPDHLFLFAPPGEARLTVEEFGEGHVRLGNIVVPYVNTNAEYQPDRLFGGDGGSVEEFFGNKKIALAAVFSTKISGRPDDRVTFAERADGYFGEGAVGKGGNGTLAGMPVEIHILREKRKLVGEAEAMRLYRDSVFCPCFRGDRPATRRIFDAMLSGCIPVVLAHRYDNHRTGTAATSYFARGAGMNSEVYPWARGSFGDAHPGMGIDYSELVVEVPAECGVDCIPPVLEGLLLNDTAALRRKQKNLARYARLFSFGMGKGRAFERVGAMSALLVAARHHATMLGHGSSASLASSS